MINTTSDRPPVNSRLFHPWKTCEVGNGWIIPAGQVKSSSIRCSASVQGKALNRKFLVHVYEDGRIHVWRES